MKKLTFILSLILIISCSKKEGCIDDSACNFESSAEIDDGSCTYTEEYYDCDGVCLSDTDSDGICDELEVVGCTDDTACNYNDTATDSDGSCTFTDGICETCEDGVIVDNDMNDNGICEVCDYDDNCYETVEIGDLEWMSENLKTTHYNNGDAIPNITNNGDWGSLTTGAYADYDNNPSNSDTYGRLYNWFTVDDSRGVCPDGWHVPSDEEYKTLEMYLGMSQSEADDTGYRGTDEGSKLAGNASLWNNGNLVSNAEFGTSGFNGVSPGYRYLYSGIYYHIGYNGYFWSSTELSSSSAWYRRLGYYTTNVYRSNANKRSGFSVRCVRPVE